MIVVKILLWKGGNPQKEEVLEEIQITNLEPDGEFGTYEAIAKKLQKVINLPSFRRSNGVLDLVFRVLNRLLS